MRIDVRGATLRFGPRTIFESFDASFAPGRVTALIGPSGSGKSSLLAAMAGYLRLRAGTIRGIDDEGRELVVTPSMVAWVPQGVNALGARSALENVMIGPLAEGAAPSLAPARSPRSMRSGWDHCRGSSPGSSRAVSCSASASPAPSRRTSP